MFIREVHPERGVALIWTERLLGDSEHTIQLNELARHISGIADVICSGKTMTLIMEKPYSEAILFRIALAFIERVPDRWIGRRLPKDQ